MAIWGIVAGALRVSVAAPEACGDLASHEVRAAADAAIGWVQRAQLDDGRYVYLYEAETDDLGQDYNDVRHAGVTMALYQSAGRGGEEQALVAADAGLCIHLHNLDSQLPKFHRSEMFRRLTKTSLYKSWRSGSDFQNLEKAVAQIESLTGKPLRRTAFPRITRTRTC